jgi:hypothetical protein
MSNLSSLAPSKKKPAASLKGVKLVKKKEKTAGELSGDSSTNC